jgi:hypothetical protein
VQDAILIDVSGSAVFGRSEDQTRGGADTSLENNNVYSVEPKVYVETAGVQEASAVRILSNVVQRHKYAGRFAVPHGTQPHGHLTHEPSQTNLWPDCLTADRDQQSGPDVGTIATSAVAVTGAIALAVAGTATAKYWQVRCRRLSCSARLV